MTRRQYLSNGYFPMLTTKTRLKLQDILTRLSKNEIVSLDERILVQKYADRNSTVWHWLRKARSIQAKGNLEQGSMGGFMQQMNLPGQTSEDHLKGSQDGIGEWFQGSPQWVRRSWFSCRGKRVGVLHTPWLEKSSAPCVGNGGSSLGSRGGSSFPFFLWVTTEPVRLSDPCYPPFYPVLSVPLWNGHIHKQAPSQWLQWICIVHSCVRRRAILIKPAESTPGGSWNKEEPPPLAGLKPHIPDTPMGVVCVFAPSIYELTKLCQKFLVLLLSFSRISQEIKELI